MNQQIVIKLGGSLLSRGEDLLFDFAYLEKLKQILVNPDLDSMKYFLAIGGGYTMRKYRDLAREAGIESDIEIHWVGTTVNVLHAYLVKAYLSDIADEEVIKYEDYYEGSDWENKQDGHKVQIGGGSSVIAEDVESKFRIAHKVKVGGGGRPGHSGDVDAILAAEQLGTNTVASLKNVDGVYEADPKTDPEALRLDKLTWKEYLDIIGGKRVHQPGGNYPVDPVASHMAQERNMKFVILAGDDLPNFLKYLKGEEFVGTLVG